MPWGSGLHLQGLGDVTAWMDAYPPGTAPLLPPLLRCLWTSGTKAFPQIQPHIWAAAGGAGGGSDLAVPLLAFARALFSRTD